VTVAFLVGVIMGAVVAGVAYCRIGVSRVRGPEAFEASSCSV